MVNTTIRTTTRGTTVKPPIIITPVTTTTILTTVTTDPPIRCQNLSDVWIKAGLLTAVTTIFLVLILTSMAVWMIYNYLLKRKMILHKDNDKTVSNSGSTRKKQSLKNLTTNQNAQKNPNSESQKSTPPSNHVRSPSAFSMHMAPPLNSGY